MSCARPPSVHCQQHGAGCSRRLHRPQCQGHDTACSATRRAATGMMVSTLLSMHASPAHALKTVELRDGTNIEVFEHGMSLNMVALRGSVPNQWITDYRLTLGKYAGFALGQRGQLDEIYKELSDLKTKNSAGVADVTTLGDVYLAPAIREGLIQPIPNAESSRWWHMLGPRWQHLLRRNRAGAPDAQGQPYGAPYRWGATVIAYRRDKLTRWGGRPLQDWQDLLQPQLHQRVAFLDSSRELLAVALKSLGLSANTQAHDLPSASGVTLEMVAQRVSELRSQVRLFSNRDHIRALTAGDVWAVVGWSNDLIAISERSTNVEVVAPQSGMPLFADVWAVPSGATGGNMQTGPSPLLPSWLEFCVAPARAISYPGLKAGASPCLLPTGLSATAQRQAGANASQDNALKHEHNYLPHTNVLRRSEFLLPLDGTSVNVYRSMLA